MQEPDDGLFTPEVGAWAEDKYAHVRTYAEIFATSMRHKWKNRVYLDLFAGAGKARLRESGRIVKSSALLALGVTHPFDRYIFCDCDPRCITALRARAAVAYPGRDIVYLEGDVNMSVRRIVDAIPRGSRENTVLTFCFVDPYNLGDISLSTLCSLCDARFMDFLILVATDMDANRNEATYTASESSALASFLGVDDWRTEWAAARARGVRFGAFVLDQVSKRMSAAGYLKPHVDESVLVRNVAKNAPLYRLAFYSKHELGRQFWKETRRYSTPQTNLFS